MGELALTAAVAALAAVMLIAATASPRMYVLNTDNDIILDSNATNATLVGKFLSRSTMYYGLYTVEHCVGEDCTVHKENCDYSDIALGSDCADALNHRCRAGKAFSIFSIFGALICAIGLQAVVWSDSIGAAVQEMEWTVKLVAGIAAAVTSFSCMIVFGVYAAKVEGEAGVSDAGCGFGEQGSYGLSFIFYVLVFLIEATAAVLLLLMPDIMTPTTRPSFSKQNRGSMSSNKLTPRGSSQFQGKPPSQPTKVRPSPAPAPAPNQGQP